MMHKVSKVCPIAALFLAVAVLLSSCSSQAKTAYQNGRTYFANQQYEEALEQFQVAGNEGSSKQYIDYIQAIRLAEQGDDLQAAERFQSLGDFLDSQDEAAYYRSRYEQSQQQNALQAFQSGDYEGALQYDTLEPNAVTYAKARLDAEDEQHVEALQAFQSLGDFLDSEEQTELIQEDLLSSQYKIAVENFEREDYESAKAVFQSLPEAYRDTHRYLAYLQALQMEEEQNLEKARDAFLALDAFLDSRSHAAACGRQLSQKNLEKAVLLAKEGKIASATDLMPLIDESADKEQLSSYVQVLQVMRDIVDHDHHAVTEEPLLQLEALGDYLDAPSYLVYLQAIQSAQEGDFQTAADQMRSLGTFLDAESRALAYQETFQRLTLASATDCMQQANFGLAQDYFLMIQELPEAEQYLRYLRALQFEREGDIENALSAFMALDDFLDSQFHAEALKKVRQESLENEARRLWQEGDITKAQAIWEQLSESEEARRYLLLQEGKEWLQKGQYSKALTCFEQLGDFEDSLTASAEAKAAIEALNLQKVEAYLGAGQTAQAERMLDTLEPQIATERARTYLLARELEDASAYAGAHEMYTTIEGYLDSAQRADTCIDKAQEVLIMEIESDLLYGELNHAEEKFLKLQESQYVQSLQLYLSARRAEERGERQTAMEQYDQLGDLLDSRERHEKLQLEQREQTLLAAYAAVQSGDVEGAMVITDTPMQDVIAEALLRYWRGQAQEESGALDAAKENYQKALTVLPDTMYSLERIAQKEREMAYEAVIAALSNGDLDQAAMLLRTTDVTDAAMPEKYLQARGLMEQEYYAAAWILLESMGDFLDSAELSRACLDLIAQKNQNQATEAMEEEDYTQAESSLFQIPRARWYPSQDDLLNELSSRSNQSSEDCYSIQMAINLTDVDE